MAQEELSQGTTIQFGPRNRERTSIADVFDPINYGNRAIRLADKGGKLEASGVWALCFFLLSVYAVWKERWYRKDRDDSQRIRADEAATMLLTANALQKLSDAYDKLETIIDERLPRRP